MSGTLFFKVAWDALTPHLSSDYVSVFEPEAGLPPIKSMMSQTQGGATCAVNARRWCVNYLYAALKRIEELEAMACLGGDEASQRRIKKLEDDLSATRGLLESRGKDMDAIMTALADVPSKGSIMDRINYLLNKNREVAETPAPRPVELSALTGSLNRIRLVLREAGNINVHEGKNPLVDDVHLLAQGVNAMGVSLVTAQKDLRRLEVEHRRNTTQPGGNTEELAELRDALGKAKRNGQVYYSGWNRSKNTKPITDYEKLAVALASAVQRGVDVPLDGAGGLATPDQLVDAAVAVINTLDKNQSTPAHDAPEGINLEVERPSQKLEAAIAKFNARQPGDSNPLAAVSEVLRAMGEDAPKAMRMLEDEVARLNSLLGGVEHTPAQDLNTKIQELTTELAQLKDQMLTDEHANLELQNKLTSVANSRDSLNRELTATWELLPEELQGMRTSLPEAIASLLRIWTTSQDKVKELTDKVKELTDKVVLNVERRHILLAYLTKLFPSTIMHQPSGPEYPWSLRFTTPHGTFAARVADKYFNWFKHVPVVTEQPGSTLGLYNAMQATEPVFTRLRTKEDQEAQDQITHLQDTVKDLTAELESRPKAPNRGGTVRVGDHALMCHSYHVDGKVGQLPSTMTFVSDEREEALSLGNFTGIPAPLQARYIREDVALEMAQEEKPSIAAAAPTGPASPQDQIAQAVTEMVCNLLDTEHERQPKGRLTLEWQPDKSRPCGKSYDDYESGVITLVSSITPALAATPQEGTNLALDVHHLTVLLAWEGDHPATWKEGVTPLIINKTI